ncbi:ribonuclease HI family protein [Leptospira wolffii]|uniref:Ribonuclease H n=1 Tax=Leptospira wolffii TaxID=409998 RepID=A0A2M9ZDD9_9LEPT|nr:ribonuclease HI family protein [Leptospira wolffii]EPG67411.1 ribonuclease HI [Leptospira wolffii serovar Khorat str. Khorat-H2]PJZ66394.1 ribonuclease H [Leptospira wolffii]TGK60048.1 ribonuclease HI family protein [Leptospira wolffii]TGK72391.1 ribonuclease HI family protein [Leptospira wolffii]TGK76055.1 ribonuclease HI family protein [Leptospira wolffii]
MKSFRIYCDGASKGNPGPSSIGVSILDGEEEIHTISERIPDGTNNTAEWAALEAGLKYCLDAGATEVHAFLDSELVVKQFRGEYKVKSPHLQIAKDKIRALSSKLKSFRIEHVPREKNKRADKLANMAF